MPFAGIDVGSLTAQAVLIEDGRTPLLKTIGVKLLSRSIRVKPNPLESARTVMGELLEESGFSWDDIVYCVSTGYGRDRVQDEGLSQENVSEISCHGIGAFSLEPRIRTVIDIGGQDAKVIRMDQHGELANFVMNDKCAAGTGRFLELMAKALGVELEQLGPLALSADDTIGITKTCSVLAMYDVLCLLYDGETPQRIASGVCMAMAERISKLAKRVGIKPEVAMTGGVAKNTAVVAQLKEILGVEQLELPDIDPQIIGALGAALFAEERAKRARRNRAVSGDVKQ